MRTILRVLALAATLAMATTGASAPARADDPDFLALSGGVFDFDDHERSGELRLEYRSKIQWWWLRPFTGIMATTDASFYGYGGVLIDLFFGRRFVITPSLAAGGYVEGGGKDLGHVIEFRSQIEIAYRFDDRSRLALSLSHISNASLGHHNPGANSIMLTYVMPFSRIFGR